MADDFVLPQIQACAMRLTKLDSTGAPLVGAGNMYVSDAFVTVDWKPEYEDGEAITEKNACAAIVVNFKGAASLKFGTLSLTLTAPDPWLVSFLGGGSLLVAGPVTGLAAPAIGPVGGDGVSVELWSRRARGGTSDATYPWAHWAYPLVKNLRLGGHTHENGSIKPTFTGETFENLNWGDGPVGDWLAASDQMYQFLPVATIPTLTPGVPGAVLIDA